MDQLIHQMELAFFQNETEKALKYAKQVLDQLDPDDDDDLERLRDVLHSGLNSESGRAFTDLLMACGFDASVTWPGKGGIAILYATCNCGDLSVFQILEELGMDPFLADRAGNTVLHTLAGMNRSPWGKEREVKMTELAQSRVDLSGWLSPNAYGATPLHLAVLNGHTELLQALLEQGVEPNLRGTAITPGYGHVIDFDGVTALDLACLVGDEEAVNLLLQANATDDQVDVHGRTAAHYAVAVPNQHYCAQFHASIPGKQQVLEKKGTILRRLQVVDKPDDKGVSPLLAALETFQFDEGNFASLLLEQGADPNRGDNQGYTPLMAAAEHYSREAAKALIAAGADLNARESHGRTALLLAVQLGDEKMARLLIKKGADPNLADNNGVTPGDLAAQRGLDAVLDLLL